MHCDLFPPHQTQRPVFPHWAFPKTLALGIRRELRGLDSHKFTNPRSSRCLCIVLPFGHRKGRWLLLLGLQAKFLSQSRELLRQLDTLPQSGRWAFGGQFFRSGTIVQAGLLPYRQKRVSGQAPWLHEHYPVSQLIWACPTPDQGRQRVISSPKALRLGPHPAGPPRFLNQSVSTRRPLSPRRARQLHTPVTSLPALGFTYPGRMATPIKFTKLKFRKRQKAEE
jgi:hypothetical protein